jgi:hypothetical protein
MSDLIRMLAWNYGWSNAAGVPRGNCVSGPSFGETNCRELFTGSILNITNLRARFRPDLLVKLLTVKQIRDSPKNRHIHSYLRATIGSTRIALRAGM